MHFIEPKIQSEFDVFNFLYVFQLKIKAIYYFVFYYGLEGRLV